MIYSSLIGPIILLTFRPREMTRPRLYFCHRVIGADGSLTGCGAGVEVKRFLLDMERGLKIS